MNRTGKIIICAFVAVLLVCTAFICLAPKGGQTALIYLDGELLQSVDLSAVEAAYLVQVGEGNVLLVEPGRISMHSANCPDQLCVKQGAASEVQPVVCLPNRVMVIIEGLRKNDLDAVAGGLG